MNTITRQEQYCMWREEKLCTKVLQSQICYIRVYMYDGETAKVTITAWLLGRDIQNFCNDDMMFSGQRVVFYS